MRISSQTANLHKQASNKAETTSQALYGENIRVLSKQTNWLEIELQTDKYTGFVEAHHVCDLTNKPTHRVNKKATPLFEQANIKSPVALLLSMGSELNLRTADNNHFWKTDTDHYVWKEHVGEFNQTLDDSLIDIAKQFFTGVPYLWGGRSTNGLDCSALVQLSAMLQGHALPRDTKDQEAYFLAKSSAPESPASTPINLIDYAHRQTNDLMYWPGHVAIVENENTLFHATAHSLDCRVEPLSAVEDRAGIAHAIWRL